MMNGKKNSKKPQIFFDSDDADLNLFCRIEDALNNATNTKSDIYINENEEEEKSRLAAQFPNCFVQQQESPNVTETSVSRNEVAQFHDAYRELQLKLDHMKIKQKEIERDASWVLKEKRELERERKRLEVDRQILDAKLDNIELIDLRKKYEELQKQYQTEKDNWEKEKYDLLFQIEELKKGFDVSNDKSIHVNFDIPTNSKKQVIKAQKTEKVLSDNQNIPLNTFDKNHVKKDKLKKTNNIVPKKKSLHPNYNLNLTFDPGPVLKEEARSNGRKLLRYKNNISGTRFSNGTIKMKLVDSILIIYTNGDTAQEFPDGSKAYRFCETEAVELVLPDKTIFYEFKNGQRETHHINGDKDIFFPNGQFKVIHPNGDYEIHYPSGKVESVINGQTIKTFI